MADYTPERDASLGLVFRLNNLWAQTDYAVLSANYDRWDVLLDRIYCNLLYREDVVVEEDDKKQILNVKLSKKDTEVYTFLSKQIHASKIKIKNIRNSVEKSKARSKLYHALQKKDIWLRKKMQELQLYLKENKNSPGQSMFGTQKR